MVADVQDKAFHSLMAEYYFDKWLYLIGLPIHWDGNILDEALKHQKNHEKHRDMDMFRWEKTISGMMIT